MTIFSVFALLFERIIGWSGDNRNRRGSGVMSVGTAMATTIATDAGGGVMSVGMAMAATIATDAGGV
jgi:hypothetical protein